MTSQSIVRDRGPGRANEGERRSLGAADARRAHEPATGESSRVVGRLPLQRTAFSGILLVSLAWGAGSCTSDAREGLAGAAGMAGNLVSGGRGAQTAGGPSSDTGGTSSNEAGGTLSTGSGPGGLGGTEDEEGAAGSGAIPVGNAGAGSGAAAGGGTGELTLTAFDCRVEGDGLTTLVFVNRCIQPVIYRGSDIEGGELGPGTARCVDIGGSDESLPSKRYWGWVGSDPGPEHHTLAEFTFNTDFYDFDWYNISHVDAHNLPMQIVPEGREDCEVLTCADSLLAGCPEEGRLMDSSGETVACVSPNRDSAESPVARYFESCDDAYAWSGDDQEGTDPSPMRACAGEDWNIIFCPEEES